MSALFPRFLDLLRPQFPFDLTSLPLRLSTSINIGANAQDFFFLPLDRHAFPVLLQKQHRQSALLIIEFQIPGGPPSKDKRQQQLQALNLSRQKSQRRIPATRPRLGSLPSPSVQLTWCAHCTGTPHSAL